MTRNLTIVVMAVACALLLGGVLYLRIAGAGAPARLGIVVVSLMMAVLMVRLAARAGENER